MHEIPPRYLFKYLSSERIDVLKNSLIRYSQLSAFNDPFDLNPVYSSEIIWKKNRDEGMGAQTRRLEEYCASRGLDPGTPEFFDCVSDGLVHIAESESNQWGYHRAVDNSQKSANADIRKPLDKSVGILCLSECDPIDTAAGSALMWAHYGEMHKGFALRLKTTKRLGRRREGSRVIGRICPVKYVDTRPEVDARSPDPDKLYLTKGMPWAYEKEWRIVRHFRHAKTTLGTGESPVHLFGLPSVVVDAVILGCNVESKLAIQILWLFSTSKSLQNASLLQTEMSGFDYQLRYKRMIDPRDSKMRLAVQENLRLKVGDPFDSN